MRACAGVAVALVAASLATADDPAGRKKSEAEWAKEVATDFLKAVKAEDNTQGLQLLTPKLEARNPPVRAPFPLGGGGRIERWEFSREKVAPDKDEISLEGKVVGKNSETGYESSFTIRVAKDKESGRWRVDFFLFETCQMLPAKK